MRCRFGHEHPPAPVLVPSDLERANGRFHCAAMPCGGHFREQSRATWLTMDFAEAWANWKRPCSVCFRLQIYKSSKRRTP